MCVSCYIDDITQQLCNIDEAIEDDVRLTSSQRERLKLVKDRLEVYLNSDNS